MKNKYFKLAILILTLSSVFCLGFGLFSKSKIEAVAAADSVETSKTLVGSDGKPYNSTLDVGEFTGLGQYPLDQSATLEATAFTGFQLVKWQISYPDKSDSSKTVVKYLDATNSSVIISEYDSVSIEADFVDYDNDNNYDRGNLQISKVFEHMNVVPVFDYVYYNLNATTLAEVCLPTNSKTIGEDTLYYGSLDNGVYSNAFVKFKNSTDIYYYGTIYSDGSKFYTIHDTSYNIDYSRGAFRLGDSVNINLNVNTDKNNIDVIGVMFNGSALTKVSANDLSVGNYKIAQDTTLRTTNITAKVNIAATSNIININYDNLYRATLKLTIDGEVPATNDVIKQQGLAEIYTLINITRAYKKIDDYNFYVKTNSAFKVECLQTYTKEENYRNYDYYTFDSIDGNVNSNEKTYSYINQDFDIVVNYLSVKYDVNFVFALYDADSSQIDIQSGNYNVLAPIGLVRGETKNFNKNNASDFVDNIGYKFEGYSTVGSNVLNETISYSVDANEPSGTTIVLCYSKIKYNVQFIGYNYSNFKLNNGGDIYAVNRINLNGTDLSTDLISTTGVFNNSLTIGETATLYAGVNEGFTLIGFNLSSGDSEYLPNNQFTLSTDIIQNTTDKTVKVYVYVDFVLYNLKYIIEPVEGVVRAKIWANAPANSNAIIVYKNANGQVIGTPNINSVEGNLATIVEVSNLKRYETVELYSFGVSVTDGEKPYTFRFDKFTENGMVELSKESVQATNESGNTENGYKHAEKILINNRTIKVVYLVPSTTLSILLPEEFKNAINLLGNDAVVVNQVGVSGSLSLDGDKYIINAGSKVTITINKNAVNFGYKIVGATIDNNAELSSNTPLTFEFTPEDTTEEIGYKITLNFEYITYRVVVIDSNETPNELINKNVTLKDGVISFNKTEGYYLINAQVKNGNGWIDYDVMNQSNLDKLTDTTFVYSYDLSTDLESLISNYAVEDWVDADDETKGKILVLTFKVDFAIYTFDVTVYHNLFKGIGDSRDTYIQYPEIKLAYKATAQSEETVLTVLYTAAEKCYKFTGIPYKSYSVKVYTADDVVSGFKFYGWLNTEDVSISQSETYVCSNITADQQIKYTLEYETYFVEIRSTDSNKGNPSISIEKISGLNNEDGSIVMYLNLAIDAQPVVGYKFKEVSYYTVYQYNNETWNDDKLNLFEFSQNKYVLTSDSDYDESKTYYVLNNYNSEQIKDLSFDINNYSPVNLNEKQTVIFYVSYELRKFTIINKNNHYFDIDNTSTNKNVLNGAGDNSGALSKDYYVNIPLEDYSIVTIWATSSNTELTESERKPREIKLGDTIDIFDSIKVVVKINDKALNKYDLNMGLILKVIRVGNQIMSYSTSSEGYVVDFEMRDKISQMSTDAASLSINYYYEVSNKSLIVTTIIPNKSFYEVQGGNSNGINITINERDYGFGDTLVVTEFDTDYSICCAQDSLQFLATTRVDCDLGVFSAYFKLSNIYLQANGEKIKEVDFDKYGINIQRDAEGNIVCIYVLYVANMKIEFIVEPIINIDSRVLAGRTFQYDSDGYADESKMLLTVGDDKDIYDIAVASVISSFIKVEYFDFNGNKTTPDKVLRDAQFNVIPYSVKISFNATGEYSWLSKVEPYTFDYLIKPKEIQMIYQKPLDDSGKTVVYDGNNEFILTDDILNNLIFTDGNVLRFGFYDFIDKKLEGKDSFTISTPKAYTYYTTLAGEVKEGVDYRETAYDLRISNLILDYKNNSFNRNFTLIFEEGETDSLSIKRYVRILKKEIRLSGIKVYNKVDDGTDVAYLDKESELTLLDLIEGVDVNGVAIDKDKLQLKYKNYVKDFVGYKDVVVNANIALTGTRCSNYTIKDIVIPNIIIYDYSKEIEIEDYGKIVVYNEKGRTDFEYANLIPLNSKLEVQLIKPESTEYIKLYDKISKHISRTNVFGVAYKLSFNVDGYNHQLNKNLVVTLPAIPNLIDVVYINGENSEKLEYTNQENVVKVDLSQTNGIEYIFMTQKFEFLPLWAIILIVVGSVAVVAGIVIAIIVVRKKKLMGYSKHDKI